MSKKGHKGVPRTQLCHRKLFLRFWLSGYTCTLGLGLRFFNIKDGVCINFSTTYMLFANRDSSRNSVNLAQFITMKRRQILTRVIGIQFGKNPFIAWNFNCL